MKVHLCTRWSKCEASEYGAPTRLYISKTYWGPEKSGGWWAYIGFEWPPIKWGKRYYGGTH